MCCSKWVVLQHSKNKIMYLQLFYSDGNANAAAINQYCFQNNIALNHLQMKKKSLETKFLNLLTSNKHVRIIKT